MDYFVLGLVIATIFVMVGMAKFLLSSFLTYNRNKRLIDSRTHICYGVWKDNKHIHRWGNDVR